MASSSSPKSRPTNAEMKEWSPSEIDAERVLLTGAFTTAEVMDQERNKISTIYPQTQRLDLFPNSLMKPEVNRAITTGDIDKFEDSVLEQVSPRGNTVEPGLLTCALPTAEVMNQERNKISTIYPETQLLDLFLNSWMKPEVYRAITIGDINKFEDSVLEQVSPRGNTVLHVAASLGHYQLVEVILNRYPQLLKRKNTTGDLALHLAASAGHQSIVKRIVQASGTGPSGQVEILIEENKEKNITESGNDQLDILIEKNQEGNTALHLAMKNCHYELARFLVEMNPEVSRSLNQEQISPLYMAAEAGHLELVKLMTKKRGIISLKEKSYVHAAIKGGNTDILDAVVRHQSTYDSGTMDEERCPWFLQIKGSNLFCRIKMDEEGRSPLSFAASIDYLDGVHYFLDKTFDATYLRDGKGLYPIHWASIRGHVNIINEFLQRCPDSRELLNDKCQNILHVAAERGKANVVRYILQKPELEMLINERDKDGNTPLHLATMGGHPTVVSILTRDERVKLELTDNEGRTALDASLNYRGTMPSIQQQLTWLALKYAGALPGKNRRSTWSMTENTQSTGTMGGNTQIPPPNVDSYKDKVNTLLLVATLMATLTFAAGFTIPGGNNDSDPNQGMATLVQKLAFHIFLISNTIAMYSSIVVAIILIWAQLDYLNLGVASLKLAVPLLGISLTMVSISFMAGVHLVVSNLNWLANVVLIMGSISLFALLVLFVPLFIPTSLNHHISQYISRYPLYLLILVIERVTAGREADDNTKE